MINLEFAADSAYKYSTGQEVVINVLSLREALGIIGLGKVANKLNDVGLFEIHFKKGKDGKLETYGKVGMGGYRFNLTTIRAFYDTYRAVKFQLENISKGDEGWTVITAVNQLWTGGEKNKDVLAIKIAMDIYKGKKKVKFDIKEKGHYGRYEDGVIHLNQDLVYETGGDKAKLVMATVTMAHEGLHGMGVKSEEAARLFGAVVGARLMEMNKGQVDWSSPELQVLALDTAAASMGAEAFKDWIAATAGGQWGVDFLFDVKLSEGARDMNEKIEKILAPYRKKYGDRIPYKLAPGDAVIIAVRRGDSSMKERKPDDLFIVVNGEGQIMAFLGSTEPGISLNKGGAAYVKANIYIGHPYLHRGVMPSLKLSEVPEGPMAGVEVARDRNKNGVLDNWEVEKAERGNNTINYHFALRTTNEEVGVWNAGCQTPAMQPCHIVNGEVVWYYGSMRDLERVKSTLTRTYGAARESADPARFFEELRGAPDLYSIYESSIKPAEEGGQVTYILIDLPRQEVPGTFDFMQMISNGFGIGDYADYMRSVNEIEDMVNELQKEQRRFYERW